MRRNLSRIFRRAQNFVGFRLSPHQVSAQGGEPPRGPYSRNKIFSADLSKAFTLKRMLVSELHPWVQAIHASDIFPYRQQVQACAEHLASFYGNSQPSSLPEFLGAAYVPNWLYHVPPNLDFFPWEDIPSSVILRFQCSGDCSTIGGHSTASKEWPGFGRQARGSVEGHARRLVHLYRAIRAEGFKATDTADGVPTSDLLVRENRDHRWLIRSGTHRVAAAKAADLGSVPVRINAIVYRAEVASWPGVQKGLFSTQEALGLFDLYFS